MITTAPLSKEQYGLYVECSNHQGETCYNVPLIHILDGSLDEKQLCKTIESFVSAHPTLFTRIELNEQGDPIQTIDDTETFALEVEQTTDIEAVKATFIQPFDLLKDRLFRFRLLKDQEHYYFLIDIHHIIFDGGSWMVMLAEIDKGYAGKPMEQEMLTLADIAKEEAALAESPQYETDKKWFAEQFDCGDCYSPLLPDRHEEVPEEAILTRVMDVNPQKVEAFCKDNGIFKSSFFTAAYSYLLAKYTGDEEVLFSTIYNGRTDKRMRYTLGMFVKTLPSYAKFTADTTVLDFLKAGQEQMAGCRQHAAYSFIDVMNDLNLQFGTTFAWHGELFANDQLCGKPMKFSLLYNNSRECPIYIKAFIRDGHYCVEAEYSANSFTEALISQFLESYEAVVEGFMSHTLLRDIDITTASQVKLLDSFNQTDVPYDDTQTIVSLFRQQVKATPDKTAVVFKDKQFTYAELDDMSNRIASYIVSKGLGGKSENHEDVVAILIARSEWMAIASLGVLKAGCAYQPLDPTYPKERLNFMMQDTATRLLIADEELCSIVDEYKGEVLLTKDIENLKDSIALDGPQPESLFTLIYTSGSTGVPKGCQLEHRNTVAFCHMHKHALHIEADSRIGAYASFGFDASLLELWPPLIFGATVYIIPEEIRLDLIALNDYFEQNGITHTFMTTQVARSFVNDITNHSLKAFITGGEKLADVTPPPYLLLNGYGPSESICYVTAFPVKEKMQNIPIGKAVENMHLYIMDAYGHRLPVGAAGELWVNGPQVGRGYLNRPEKTAESFVETPWGRCYRTGDIVRYLPDGNIEFVGRKDGQVKIRGFRVELTEVEAIIRQFPGIKDATVQAFDDEGGGKFIAAYIVSDEQVNIEALNNFILDQKPPYMVPAVTMQIDAIPLNQNQKVNKKALPKPTISEKGKGNGEDYAAVPLNVLEQELHDIIAEIINTKDFGVTTVLGYVGLTSIMGIKLAIQINKRFGVTIDSKSLAKTGTLQSIENEILSAMLTSDHSPAASDHSAAQKVENANNVRLSYAQMGVYVDCMKQPTSTVYNIPSLIRFPKGTDVQLLHKSIETIIKAHPQFQVHFGSEGNDIVQIVDPNQPVVIKQSTMSEAELQQYKTEFVKPFNLRQGPMYRMEIVTTEQDVYLLVDIHHLVFDGSSFDLFLNQLCDLMNGRDIEAEAISYADFVADEKAAEGSQAYTEAQNFFNDRLGGLEGVTEMPTDLTNPLEQGTASETFCKMDFKAIEEFCKKNNISPSHLTLAAVFYSLARFTNNEQVCITTISNGRSDLRIRNTVGMFVNTLPLTARIGEQSVMDFLKETSKNFDDTLSHEKYPFAQIAADYDLSAEIMFAYQMGIIDQYLVHEQRLEMEVLGLDAAKFRIAFYIQEKDGVPGVLIEYDNGRYSPELMQNLALSVCNAAHAFIRHPEVALQSVSLLDAGQTAVLDGFNQTDVDYDNTQTIVSLFRKQVENVPDNIAVVYHDVRLTYKQVDETSERIAQYILSLGLGAEDVVSVLIPRCEWMALASLGVLKAGCAYQPLDPSYPAERLNFMMQDASAKLLIADESLRPLVNEYQGPVLFTKDIPHLSPLTSPLSPLNMPTPSSLFIMLYTSGSTGVPKGCQLEHGNLVAFCHWYQRYYELTADSRVAAYASYGFDACMMDMYPALTCGAAVYIIGEDIRLNLPDLNAYFNDNGITHSFITTQVGYQFATNVENHSLKCFAVGGEKLSALQPPQNYKMFNGYGPTECTIFTTNYWVRDYEQDIPIGKPLDNMRLYIVDKQFNRLPVGAVGELWVSGPQVSRGYLNRPEKTKEVFVDNPFVALPSPLTSKYARCYRTGDIVRYLPDGNIQFVGRKDGQVKIRGFRIELKEVEAVIRQYPDIKDATVQAFDYDNGGKFIAAYIVSDKQVDIKALNDFIGQRKPSYMIPAATMQIDSIPLNQNQKVNRKALPAPVIQASDREYVAPANDTEKLFCDIFADILSMDKIGALDNFFELGGTSLMVTRVIIEADKHGRHIAYGDLFTHPTPRQLSQFVNGDTKSAVGSNSAAANQDAEYDYTAINALLQRNTLKAFLTGERQTVGNVLLTGSTGFLGIHVLKELIDRADVPVIWCMVRGENEEKAANRLKQMLFYYFGKNYKELFGERLRIALGDVTQAISIDGRVDTVFNCAAMVKHFSRTTEIEDVNIGGAVNCVRFCLKTGARLVHVSTYSTAGLSVNGMPGHDAVHTEQSLYCGQYMENQYVHSKFVSERVVLEAVAVHGLNGKVMRVGNLAPRSTDGEFQINFQTNSAMGRIRVFKMLGCYPYEMSDEPMEFSPINEVAHSIVLLSQTPRENCLFHPYNNHHVYFGDVMTQLGLIGDVPQQVEEQQFNATMEAAKNNPEKAKLLSSLLAYQDMSHGQESFIIPTENNFTTQVLYRLGFRWSTTSWDYVGQFLQAIDGLGFFDA